MGNKGFGVITKQDISAGQLVIEYVGEVMKIDRWFDRLDEEVDTKKNFYFIAIDANVGIDASAKGNIARFINHSCDPNCITEKWTVNGEWRLGIFANRDIPKGTEVTYDYQFELFGQKMQKCLCQSRNCKGVIGVCSDDSSDSDDNSSVEDDVTESSKLLSLKLSHKLENILRQDKEFLKKSKHHKLPVKETVRRIIMQANCHIKHSNQNFVHRYMKFSNDLIPLFNMMVGRMLLYRSERMQYLEFINRTSQSNNQLELCDLYGGFHLLRLMVYLPYYVSSIDSDKFISQNQNKKSTTTTSTTSTTTTTTLPNTPFSLKSSRSDDKEVALPKHLKNILKYTQKVIDYMEYNISNIFPHEFTRPSGVC
eukprot:TRINITY_DN796_c0_g1_i4.p1 TRINITY_DN796_c0_g1~~TRINITY_DN796_c0_g1_i4.p1  ORF type:complete len:367 (-),score=53.23 TRINITY_DN796_c0_g1_i4:8-1108(-)